MITENIGAELKPSHDCGMCDAPLRFDGLAGKTPTWCCTECDGWHISTDCCE